MKPAADSSSKRKRKSTDSGQKCKSKKVEAPDQSSLEDTISNLPKLLKERQKELEAREKILKAREDALQREINEADPSDVLELNVGGRTDFAVLRSTLTSIEGSMLASKFSGRWDDSFIRDSNGRIFLDIDPDLFNQLVGYLRQKAIFLPGGQPLASPPASSDLDRVLVFYECLLGVYPIVVKSRTEAPESSIAGFSVTADTFHTFELECCGHKRHVSSFHVTLGRCSRFQVGYHCKINSSVSAVSGVGKYSYSVALDMSNQVYENNEVQENLSGLNLDTGSKIECGYNSRTQTIIWKVNGEQVSSLASSAAMREPVPCFSLLGSAEVSEIKYDVPV